jgi:hypothetical protein
VLSACCIFLLLLVPLYAQIIVAKVPILKGTLFVQIPQNELLAALAADNLAAAQQMAAAASAAAATGGSNDKQRMLRVEMQVDISIGIADSSAAVNYVQRQVSWDWQGWCLSWTVLGGGGWMGGAATASNCVQRRHC